MASEVRNAHEAHASVETATCAEPIQASAYPVDAEIIPGEVATVPGPELCASQTAAEPVTQELPASQQDIAGAAKCGNRPFSQGPKARLGGLF